MSQLLRRLSIHSLPILARNYTMAALAAQPAPVAAPSASPSKSASHPSGGLTYAPLPGARFGRVVTGFDPANVTSAQMAEIEDALYRNDILLFPGTKITPKQQYEMTHHFDPAASSYGHGNNKTGSEKKSILHPDLKTIPHQPEVQLIGHGQVPGTYEGLESPKLKHPHHATFHATRVSDEDEAKGATRFYRWHIDAALYKLSPPKVTTLYAVKVPKGPNKTLRYDDGTGDELSVAPGATAFVSCREMFEQLSPALKSLAVRTKVKYAPHPYVWMSSARARPTGLGLETEGREMALDELPEWSEKHVKVLPMCWKNPVTGALHLQVHPCGAMELHVAPQPGAELFPDGATITDLAEVRSWLEKIQRPAIAPENVYPVDWTEGDLVLFHNRGLLHSVTGAFTDNDLRMFHQCNLAASSDPTGPDEADVAKYA